MFRKQAPHDILSHSNYQGGLACCDSWGRRESDTTERLIWSELIVGTLVSQVNFRVLYPSSILKEIRPEYSLERLILKLQLQYFSHLMQRNLTFHWKRPWCWERLKARRERDERGWDDWMASPTQWTWVWVSSGNWWWTGKPGVLQSMWITKIWTQLSNWPELNCLTILRPFI